MPDLELEDVLQTALDAVRKQKSDSKIDELLSRRFSLADLREAWSNASPEEKEEFRKEFGGSPAQIVEEGKEEKSPPKSPRQKPAKAAKEEAPKRTRAGRKSGGAYPFDIDDGGRVIPLSVARVYNGPDEPDEVELPDEDEDEDEDAA